MGKKPQNEEEVLGQIFDFIFKEAKKDPSKRKPIKLKPTGISTSHELVDGLAVALEKPGMLITDQMLASMNRALTIEFARMNADEKGDNSAKISTSTLANFLKNPNDFLSKPKQATKTGIRQFMNAAWLGRTHAQLQAYAWAQKYNLDLDAKKAIRGHFMASNKGSEGEAGRAFAIAAGAISTGGGDTVNSRKDYNVSRGASLIGREMFGREGWENMSEERKIGLQKALIRGNAHVKKYMFDTYKESKPELINRALRRYEDLQKDKDLGLKIEKTGFIFGKELQDEGINLLDMGNYNKLEIKNLAGRIDDMKLYLKRNPGLSVNEKARIEEGIQQLGQAAVIVSGNTIDAKTVFLAKKELNKKIKDYKEELLLARKAGDKDNIKYFKEQLKNLKRGDRELKTMQFWGTVGSWEGKYESWKGVMGGVGAENAILSILNGDFYDKDKNFFGLPCKDETIKFGSYSWRLKNEEGEIVKRQFNEGFKIKVADYRSLIDSEGKELKGRERAMAISLNRYNALMTDIYYLTPKSIMTTLFVNGEGFIHSTYKRALKLSKKLGKGKVIDLNRLMQGDKAYYGELKAMGVKPYQLFRLRASSGLARMFSFGQRQRDKVKNWMDDHVFRRLRQRMYNSLLNRFKDKGAQALLEQWLVKGGFEVLAKAIVTNLLVAIGIGATGGLGYFLAPILSAVVTDVLYSGVKVMIQFLMIIIFGIIGFTLYGMSSGKSSYDSQAYAYTNVVPGEVVSNPNFKGTSPITGEEDDEMADFIGGTLPDGQKCLLDSGSVHCSQGAFGSYSHQNVAAIDLSTGASDFFAPQFCGNDNCVVTFNGTTTCTAGSAGGMITFTARYGSTTYEFKLIHVKAASGIGVGTKLNSGQQVARVMPYGPETSACSSGTHIHLQTKVNGQAVDPWEVMTSNPSNGGFGCNISVCDP